MANNPFADDPDMKAMRASMRPQRGSAPWAGLLVGVALVACGTFIFAYYVPLYRAHQTLASSHGRIMQQIKALEDSATQAQASLKSEIAKRETLEAEKRQRESASKSSSGELESVRAALAQKLAGAISKKQAAVALDGDRLVVALGSNALFSAGKVEVSGSGKSLLCEVGKAAGARPIRVESATDENGVPALLKLKYTNAWALTTASSASVANTLEEKCSVLRAKLAATGYGENKPPRKALEGAKIGGLRVEIEIGGAERKP
jgi:chemotaxis protein MotB